jgi:hypothetical protein
VAEVCTRSSSGLTGRSRQLSLAEWLEERYANCLRIAKTKRGDDRAGWLEDASYFSRSREAVRQLIDASSDEHGNVPLRMHIALKILRAWNSGTAGFDANVVSTINAWLDDGRKGPIPWPNGSCFAQWAESNGLSKVGQYVGFRFDVEAVEEVDYPGRRR